MLAIHMLDGKCQPEGSPLTYAGNIPIQRCLCMIYWLRWGDHVFDIRIMWNILGLSEQPYFTAHQSNKVNPEFHTSFIAAIQEQDFKELMQLHDAALEEDNTW